MTNLGKTADATEQGSVFAFYEGKLPLLISMPHCGTAVPSDIWQRMTPATTRLTDTDWFMPELYDFVFQLPINVIVPKYSRYVIDLNRPENDESLYPGADTTGLCPISTFAREAIYLEGKEPDKSEITKRTEIYWRPYHHKIQQWIAQSLQQHGRAFVFEAHSIASKVPRFFDGQLTDFNFGSFGGKTVNQQFTSVVEAFSTAPYSKAINGRFKGGYITRAYGAPEQNVETLQLELSQATYMDEQSLSYSAAKSAEVQPILRQLIEKIIAYLKTND